jgi:DNA-binding phage protein
MELREKLNFVIDNLNLSMVTIAKHTGIAYQTIRQISLKEDANPTAKTTRKLNEYLNKLQK